MAGKVGALFVGLGLDDTQYRAGMAAAVGSSKKSTALMQMNFSTLNFRTFLYGMAGIYAVKRAIEGIMTPSIAFESQLANVATQLNNSAMNIMPKYRTQLEELSKTYGQSTETLTEGLYDILSAVIAPAKAMIVLEAASKAAVAGNMSVAVATSAIVTVMKSYNLEAEKATYISDVLFAAVLRGRITAEQLSSGLGVVASSAAQAGLKFEELSALISTVTRAGVPPEMALIALANALNKFVKSSPEAVATAHKLGFELNTATLKAGGMANVMRALAKATQEDVNIMFPELRGLRGINAALADSAGFLDDLILMYHPLGMTMESFNKRYKTTAETLKRFGQILLVDVVRPFTDALLPSIINAAKETGRWLELNKELIKTRLTEWANKTVDSIKSLTSTIILLHEPLKYLIYTLLGVAALNQLLAIGKAVSLLAGYFNTLTLAMAATKLGGVLGGGILGALALLTVGGGAYIGVKVFRDCLSDVDKMQFRNILEVENALGVTTTTGYKKRFDDYLQATKLAIQAGESLSSLQGKLGTKGGGTIGEFGVTNAVAQMKLLALYNAEVKKTAGKGGGVGIYEPAWNDKDYKAMMDAKKKEDDDYWDYYLNALGIIRGREQSAAKESLNIARDTQMTKLELVESGVNLQIAQEQLRLQFYLEDLRKEYSGYLDTKALEQAAEQQSANIINLIRQQAAEEAARKAAQAWEGFKDHFSSILARMVDEGEFSAKAIGDAFVDAMKRIVIQKASKLVVNTILDFLNPGGGSSILGKLLSYGTGGMVYKPSLALVGENGPERVLNPSETRRYNSTNNSDNSNVNINIYASSDDLRSMNPYKFAQLYKEAKRSQLLAG